MGSFQVSLRRRALPRPLYESARRGSSAMARSYSAMARSNSLFASRRHHASDAIGERFPGNSVAGELKVPGSKEKLLRSGAPSQSSLQLIVCIGSLPSLWLERNREPNPLNFFIAFDFATDFTDLHGMKSV